MNLEGVTLKLLLQESDSEKALQIYSELRPSYFSPSFGTIYTNLSKFYEEKGYIPSLNELRVYRSRNQKFTKAISSLELVDCSDVDIELVLDELKNQHAQKYTLDLLDGLLDRIGIMDRDELLEKAAEIPLMLEEEMSESNMVYSPKNLPVFNRPTEVEANKIHSGICNAWDMEVGGYHRQELILFGGKRGSGKSVICSNLVANQHLQGKVSIYFTIEMTADEVYQRIIGILAGVSPSKIRNNTLDQEETKIVAKTMSDMFIGGSEIFNKYFCDTDISPDIYKYQEELLSSCEEKEEGRIIIVDDRDLSLSQIDTKVSSAKSKHGDSLGLVVVDYINQVTAPGHEVELYDWKPQILVSKGLKNLARKFDIAIMAPYQIDDNGIARFSKGIEDACDVAQLIKVDDKTDGTLVFETTKARSADDTGRYRVGIDWGNLRINPEEISLEEIQPDSDSEDSEGLDFIPTV